MDPNKIPGRCEQCHTHTTELVNLRKQVKDILKERLKHLTHEEKLKDSVVHSLLKRIAIRTKKMKEWLCEKCAQQVTTALSHKVGKSKISHSPCQFCDGAIKKFEKLQTMSGEAAYKRWSVLLDQCNKCLTDCEKVGGQCSRYKNMRDTLQTWIMRQMDKR